MAKRQTILMLIVFVIMFSYTVVEGGAYKNEEALSRKGLKEERKLSFSTGQVVSGATNVGGLGSNAEIANVETGTVHTTITSNHDISPETFRRINNNRINKPYP
ncbi:hypothetical protein BRADI_5g02850v3 [Brachypodium distachyon]|uniref:Uncharacterized protein n=1 Tax=Brachypodium distachyon TaxID=15368 RepID=I1IW25_BRADI|nr:hypothetical protein BRADI_5g02850v3 [Brachypodium distachyon]KQJ81752.1 hypothetical protein BRADI_5g02850v3 [Brachypodium distachyon]KQJ81753.1 hypothetical protein BRADI_5g02850v3 [Brachypodium distachyon]PNT60646.1 hypothetical protein BRADI_5g02850v3 [Brachypodium distachyon]